MLLLFVHDNNLPYPGFRRNAIAKKKQAISRLIELPHVAKALKISRKRRDFSQSRDFHRFRAQYESSVKRKRGT